MRNFKMTFSLGAAVIILTDWVSDWISITTFGWTVAECSWAHARCKGGPKVGPPVGGSHFSSILNEDGPSIRGTLNLQVLASMALNNSANNTSNLNGSDFMLVVFFGRLMKVLQWKEDCGLLLIRTFTFSVPLLPKSAFSQRVSMVRSGGFNAILLKNLITLEEPENAHYLFTCL